MGEKIEGKRTRGRRKFGLITNILRGISFEQLKADAQD
jgi:hypothetical protein